MHRGSLLFLSLVFATGFVQAQIDAGNLSGTVRDANGGVIQPASIKVINNGTSAVANLATDEM